MVRYHNSGNQRFDDTEHDSVSTAGLTITEQQGVTITPERDITETFDSGQTRTFIFGAGSLADVPIFTTAFPANDPDNNHGYQINKIWYQDNDDTIRVEVTETENSGGGTARIISWTVKTTS